MESDDAGINKMVVHFTTITITIHGLSSCQMRWEICIFHSDEIRRGVETKQVVLIIH